MVSIEHVSSLDEGARVKVTYQDPDSEVTMIKETDNFLLFAYEDATKELGNCHINGLSCVDILRIMPAITESGLFILMQEGELHDMLTYAEQLQRAATGIVDVVEKLVANKTGGKMQ